MHGHIALVTEWDDPVHEQWPVASQQSCPKSSRLPHSCGTMQERVYQRANPRDANYCGLYTLAACWGIVQHVANVDWSMAKTNWNRVPTVNTDGSRFLTSCNVACPKVKLPYNVTTVSVTFEKGNNITGHMKQFRNKIMRWYFSRKVPLVWRYTNFLPTYSRSNPSNRKRARSVHPFWHNTGLWLTDRQTRGHRMYRANIALRGYRLKKVT